MRRGEIRFADLAPVRGAEADKRRPTVIVSNDGANRTAEHVGRGVVTIVPLTSNTLHVYPFQVFLHTAETGLAETSKAQAEQVRSLSVARLGPAVGKLTHASMGALDDALRLHLAL